MMCFKAFSFSKMNAEIEQIDHMNSRMTKTQADCTGYDQYGINYENQGLHFTD